MHAHNLKIHYVRIAVIVLTPRDVMVNDCACARMCNLWDPRRKRIHCTYNFSWREYGRRNFNRKECIVPLSVNDTNFQLQWNGVCNTFAYNFGYTIFSQLQPGVLELLRNRQSCSISQQFCRFRLCRFDKLAGRLIAVLRQDVLWVAFLKYPPIRYQFYLARDCVYSSYLFSTSAIQFTLGVFFKPFWIVSSLWDDCKVVLCTRSRRRWVRNSWLGCVDISLYA